MSECAILSIPYSFLIFDAISMVLSFALPPAPYVTLIKSGFNSLNCSKVPNMDSMGVSSFGGKISKDITGFFFLEQIYQIHNRPPARKNLDIIMFGV